MQASVLLVDDEQEVLNALTRVLRQDFEVNAFTDPQEAINFYRENPVPIVISDMKMPEMSGAQLLSEIHQINPSSRRIILTGFADAQHAKMAINEGHVTQYIFKPWDNQALLDTINEQFAEIKQESKQSALVSKLKSDNVYLRSNLKATLLEAQSLQEEHQAAAFNEQQLRQMNTELLQLSANLVASSSEDSSGHAYRVAEQSRAIARRLGMSDGQCAQIYVAALFYRVGLTTLDKSLLNIPSNDMSPEQSQIWRSAIHKSGDIMRTIHLLEPSAVMVEHLSSLLSSDNEAAQITEPQASAILLATVIHYDLLIDGKISGKKLQLSEADRAMADFLATLGESHYFRQLKSLLLKPEAEEDIEIPHDLSTLVAGMVLAHDLVDTNETKLLSAGTELTDQHLIKLAEIQEQQAPLVCFIKNIVGVNEGDSNE